MNRKYHLLHASRGWNLWLYLKLIPRELISFPFPFPYSFLLSLSPQQLDTPLSLLLASFLSFLSPHYDTISKHHEITHLFLFSPIFSPLSLSLHRDSTSFRPKQPSLVTIITHIIHLEVYWTVFLYQFDVIYVNVLIWFHTMLGF